MKKLIIILSVFILLSNSSCQITKNMNSNSTKMTTEQLDSICQIMSSECRENTLNRQTNKDTMNFRHWFPAYLHYAYIVQGAHAVNCTEKQLKEGTLRRIAEGTLNMTEEEFFGEKYNFPKEISETEYFFLNGELVKISLTTGIADYNVRPYAYWIRMEQLDLMYKDNKCNKKESYVYFDKWHPSEKRDEDWTNFFLESLGVSEEHLIQKAHILYKNNTVK